MTAESESNLIIEKKEGGVGYLQINRPKALNAFIDSLSNELEKALYQFDNDPEIGCIVLTGNEKAFSTGLDLRVLIDPQYTDEKKISMIQKWNFIDTVRKPIIAAVNGFALGGGCEIAM